MQVLGLARPQKNTIYEISPLRWFDDAAESGKLGNSMGVLAFSYKGERGSTSIISVNLLHPKKCWKASIGDLAGAIFVGEKLIGDTYVPAGEESTRVNTTDGTVNTFLCFKLYRHHQS